MLGSHGLVGGGIFKILEGYKQGEDLKFIVSLGFILSKSGGCFVSPGEALAQPNLLFRILCTPVLHMANRCGCLASVRPFNDAMLQNTPDFSLTAKPSV